MKAQAVALDQPCHSAYEKFIEITNQLRGEALSAGTHSCNGPQSKHVGPAISAFLDPN